MSEMEYRRLPRGGEELSVIGLGTGFNEFPGREEMAETVRTALDAGINLLDLTPWDARAFAAFGDALKGRRGEAHLQMHFGSGYGSGTYERVEGLEAIRRSVEWQMNQLGTDYIDFGFIHCVDDPGLLDRMHADGTIDHILRLRDEGTVRHVALSTHTPAIAQMVLDEGIVDLIMFSINPAYDYRIGKWAFGEVDERTALYHRCQKEGVGISVMKPFSKGQLFDASLSPFGQENGVGLPGSGLLPQDLRGLLGEIPHNMVDLPHPVPEARGQDGLDAVINGAEVPLPQPEGQAQLLLVQHRTVVQHLQNVLQLLALRLGADAEDDGLRPLVAPPEGHGDPDPRRRLGLKDGGHQVVVGLVEGVGSRSHGYPGNDSLFQTGPPERLRPPRP